MLALSIRQPYAELILRGIKPVEWRSRAVGARLLGRRFYIYATKAPGRADDFAALGLRARDLPTGVLVGTAIIHKCTGAARQYEWHLTAIHRLPRPRRPRKHPQPTWFKPF
jgi:hypothetical protein